jgi:hypothetical protein
MYARSDSINHRDGRQTVASSKQNSGGLRSVKSVMFGRLT